MNTDFEINVKDIPEVAEQLEVIYTEYPFSLTHEVNRILDMTANILKDFSDFRQTVSFNIRFNRIGEELKQLRVSRRQELTELKENPASIFCQNQLQQIEEFNDKEPDIQPFKPIVPETQARVLNAHFSVLCSKFNKLHGMKRTPESVKKLMDILINLARQISFEVFEENKTSYELPSEVANV